MNIIVIASAFDAISILAQGKEGVYSSSFYPATRQRGRALQTHLEIAAKEAGFLLSECEIVGIPEGPGSFTGLRLAYAAAKAINFVSGATVLAVPTLTVFDFSQKYYNGALIAMIDAKRECFYAQVFKNHQAITPIYDTHVLNILDKVDLSIPCMVVGIGTKAFKMDIESLDFSKYKKGNSKIECPSQNIHFIELSQSAITGYILEYIIENKNMMKEVGEWEGPLYVRKSDAERDKEREANDNN